MREAIEKFYGIISLIIFILIVFATAVGGMCAIAGVTFMQTMVFGLWLLGHAITIIFVAAVFIYALANRKNENRQIAAFVLKVSAGILFVGAFLCMFSERYSGLTFAISALVFYIMSRHFGRERDEK